MISFKNKKIGLLGLGEENIALAKYLSTKKARITICDAKENKKDLKSYFEDLKGVKYELRLGENYLDNLTDFDIIFRTPGLKYLHPKIQEAKENGVQVSSQTKLFFELCPAKIIGITGTKGKGTTTSLIYEILNMAKNDRETEIFINQVYVAGNIGKAPIEFLDKLEKNDIVVLELSSFQLQDMNISPHIAVVLDIKSDHLDVHSTHEEYVSAKTSIVKYQTKEDFAVINADYMTSIEFALMSRGETYWFSRRKFVDPGAYVENGKIYFNEDGNKKNIIETRDVTLRGIHNLENICAAITAAHLIGAGDKVIRDTVRKFKGLEHRLEFVGKAAGVKYYNDSFSTTPDTAIAAIKSFTEPIILIAGGSDKGAYYAELGEVISKSSIKVAILIGRTGPKIKEEIQNKKIHIIDSCQNIEDVFRELRKVVKKGDIVLMSPASASFDWFKNYKDRGKLFKKLVMKEIS